MVNVRKLLQISIAVLALMVLVFLSAFVTLKVMTWGETVSVPELRGMDLADAVNVLKETGLEASVDRQEHHESVPENAVIYQEPPAGRNVKKGRGVSLSISLGSEEVDVPPVVGEVFNRAHILLTRSGLALGDVSRIVSDHPRDAVLAQLPPEAEVLQKGEQVALLVSGGRQAERFVTPNLEGLSLKEAERLTNHMAVRMITSGRGAVIVSQSPKPGYALLAGGALHVTLGSVETRKPPVVVN
jgi:serine/threonine-protein kinase